MNLSFLNTCRIKVIIYLGQVSPSLEISHALNFAWERTFLKHIKMTYLCKANTF